MLVQSNFPVSQPNAIATRCIACNASGAATGRFRCASCGDLLEVVTQRPAQAATLPALWRERRRSDTALDRSGVWRFREALPGLVAGASMVTLEEGNTPLYELPRLAAKLGLEQLLAKHQGMNPTGSFKDTGMTVAVSRAREEGCRWVACASTGNTSASMAAYAARAGLGALVLVPEGQIAWGKLAQALDYGALTFQIRADFDGCVRVLDEIVGRAPVYLVNSVNPLRLEGQKTAALELWEQLQGDLPDHLLVPGGNLANGSALGKGLLELQDWGLTTRLPKISVVQAAGADPLARAWQSDGARTMASLAPESLATAIRIGKPASWKKAAAVIAATGGTCLAVSEAEIALAKAEIGAEGLGCEPASAATLAGLKRLQAQGFVERGERVALVLTGHLLKDADYALRFHLGTLPLGDFAAQERPPEVDGALAARRRAPISLAADADAVLRRLEQESGRA